MTKKDKQTAKNRIFEAAVDLFARKGFDAVGVREIAEAAEVNISMISYYYGGKTGILKCILEQFHGAYLKILEKAAGTDGASEEKIAFVVSSIVDFMRGNTSLVIAGFNIMPLEIPEIHEIKSKKVHQLMQAAAVLFKEIGIDSKDQTFFAIIGPTFISMLLSHFRFQSVQKDILRLKFDETFYKRYKNILTTLLLSGIKGIIQAQETENI